MRQPDFPQHSSTLCPSARHSVNSPFDHGTFRQLPSTIFVTGKHFVRKLDLPLNFRQLSVWPNVLPSSFCASAGPSVIFRKHSVQPRTSVNLRQLVVRPRDLPSNFRASAGPFANFPCSCRHYVNFPFTRTTFRQLSTTFRASERLSVNFPYGSGAFRQISVWPRTFCQLSLRQHNLLSVFVIFPCINWTFCKTYINFPCL